MKVRNMSLALVASAIVAIVAALPSNPVMTFGSSTEPMSPEYERALLFRQTFGLDDDPKVIVLAQSDSRYSSSDYGVPLSSSEEGELQRRVQLEWDSHAAVDFGSSQPTWAGYFIDQHARGAPVFLFTGNEEALRLELEKLLPSDSGFRVEHVDHTLKDLQDLQMRIVSAWEEMGAEGIDFTHTGIDLAGNQVTVGIDGLTEDAIQRVTSRFGPNIEFRDSPPAVADSCPETSCRPIKAGIKELGEGGYPCTAGFILRRELHGAPLSVLTAGHCIWVNGPHGSDPQGGLNKAWTHTGGSTTARFGDSKWAAYFENSVGDAGLIEIDSDEQPSPANKMYINSNGSSGAIYTVTNYVPDTYQTLGAQACAYGYKSNDSACVTITDYDEANQSRVDFIGGGYATRTILHTKEYGWNLIGGDSGGPIYQVAPGSMNRWALGLHVHSDPLGPGPGTGWYTPLGQALQAYIGVSGGEGFMVCTTASC